MLRRLGVLIALSSCLVAGSLAPAHAEDPPPTPSVNITADKAIYLANQTAHLTVDVVAMNLTYVMAYQYPGSSTWNYLNGSVNVNDTTFNESLYLIYNVKIRAELIDQKGTEDTADDETKASDEISLSVRATLGTSAYSYYTKSGSYKVFNRGISPKFRSASFPALPGNRCLRHQVQRKYASGWRTVKTSACIVEAKQGRVDWQWGGKHPSRVNFRVRATFAGDAANRSNNGAWLYFRFR